jgi:hypothetical protein
VVEIPRSVVVTQYKPPEKFMYRTRDTKNSRSARDTPIRITPAMDESAKTARRISNNICSSNARALKKANTATILRLAKQISSRISASGSTDPLLIEAFEFAMKVTNLMSEGARGRRTEVITLKDLELLVGDDEPGDYCGVDLFLPLY